jgi:H+-transporting ATPase
LGTQALATLIAVYGIFMTPIGWRYAALVWGYALACFVTDRVKLVAYRILDPINDRSAHVVAVAPGNRPAPRARLAPRPPSGVASTVTLVPFHTDTNADDPVYHDNADCPYGLAIKHHGTDKSGQDGRRRCDWCTEHAEVRVHPHVSASKR